MSKNSQRYQSRRRELQKAYETGYKVRMGELTFYRDVPVDRQLMNQWYLGWKHAAKRLSELDHDAVLRYFGVMK